MPDNLFSVADKVVLVTGAARGNGRAIAEGFIHHGAIVYLVDILPEVMEVAAGCGEDRAFPIVADIRDRQAMERLMAEVADRQRRIDVLVNNAGITLAADDPYDQQIWDRTMAVNLHAAFQLATMAARVMKKQPQGGVIINITSLGAMLGFPNNPAYVASKGGLRQLTKAMAYDLSRYNIRVNNICPGYMRTDMTRKSYQDQEIKAERDRRIMLGRWGKPEDLVGPCIFLASEASSYITGIDLPVDGGWLAKGL